MENNAEYLKQVKNAVEHLHECSAVHLRTELVHEVFRGETVWQGRVEVFALTGHPKAKYAYAWSHKDGPGDCQDRFVAVLEIPPIVSAVMAVRAAIVAETRRIKAN